jgi:hypothetical protein
VPSPIDPKLSGDIRVRRKSKKKAKQKQSKSRAKAEQKQSKRRAKTKQKRSESLSKYFLKLHVLFFFCTGMLKIIPEMNGKNRIELSFIYKYELIDMQRIIRIDLKVLHASQKTTLTKIVTTKLPVNEI